MSAGYFSWFCELDGLLAETRRWWQFRAFESRDYPWRQSCPQLAAELDALDDSELAALEADRGKALARWQLWIPQLQRLCELTRLPAMPRNELPFPPRLDVGVPGKKWQQICDFVASIPPADGLALEWCAGKGHLGRLLSVVHQCSVSSLEWQARLCAEGERLALRDGARQSFLQLDALALDARQQVGLHDRVVALHACGELHTRLLLAWLDGDSTALHIAPCCYQLISSDCYIPLSLAAQAARLTLSRTDLSLPLQELVTGGEGARRRRLRELQLRLAFDEWQRECRAVDEYLPLPAVRQSLLWSFPEFLGWACEHGGLSQPLAEQRERYLQAGERRAARVRRMESISHLFRRALELWLVLDRALCLLESGADVRLGEFCDYRLSPRNILISAYRQPV